jgi:hypothetical protein
MPNLEERKIALAARKEQQNRGDAYLNDDPGGYGARRSAEEWNSIYAEEVSILTEENQQLRNTIKALENRAGRIGYKMI